jgi:glycosyltransferase involved in cell wall biosynthesis
MPVDEKDISILIPTYRYPELVIDAVKSSLRTDAGEIIIVDDSSKDGTIEKLRNFNDSRLRIFENSENLGLWENHLQALKYASCPWIKFLQADDIILSDGLARMAEVADEKISLIWASPIYYERDTNKKWVMTHLSKPTYFTTDKYLNRLSTIGWELGCPSYWLLRSDIIERDENIWQSNKSADFIIGTISVSRGDVVLLPPGNVQRGCHKFQETYSQGVSLILSRSVNTIEYLLKYHDKNVNHFVSIYSFVEGVALLRILLSTSIKGYIPRMNDIRNIIKLFRLADWKIISRSSKQIIAMLKRRWDIKSFYKII